MMFPSDAVTVSVDAGNNVTTTISGTFLSAVGYDRTLLYASAVGDDSDTHIGLGVSTTPYLDTEGFVGQVETYAPVVLPASTTLTWSKTNGDKKEFMQVVYVPRLITTGEEVSFFNNVSLLVVFGVIVIVLLLTDFIRRFVQFGKRSRYD